jgi:uncharacterized surface protein with fasciclin (FAS1) repeats
MTSVQGTDPSYNYSHMYDIKDLRGNLPTPVYNQGTILCALHQAGCFQNFIDLVTKAGLAGIFNSKQTNITVFAPNDEALSACSVKGIDSFKAKQLVLYHTLEKSIPPSFLRSSKAMYLDTQVTGSRLLVENLRTPVPLINRCTHVVQCPIATVNSMIYPINKVLLMDNNPLSNISI